MYHEKSLSDAFVQNSDLGKHYRPLFSLNFGQIYYELDAKQAVLSTAVNRYEWAHSE